MAGSKQAIVVIHGIGEQIPMDTLRAFVRGVWETDPSLTSGGSARVNPQDVWSKPDQRTGSLELRRITTRETKHTKVFRSGVRSDFYELYWADLSAGSTWGHIQSWLFDLLFRSPFSRVPKNVFMAWVMLWVASLTIAVFLVGTVLPRDDSGFPGSLWKIPPFEWISGLSTWVLALVSGFLTWATQKVVIPYVGRIVRYTRAYPDNVKARQLIRERGLELFERLHRDEEYERVIVVGHSLGSILAYDLISYFWATRKEARTIAPGTAEFAALQAVETAAAGLECAPSDAGAVATFHKAQRELSGQLRKRGLTGGSAAARWLITDLVTLGSPLGHAHFLLADSKEVFEQRCNMREFAITPPFREALDPNNVTAAQAVGLPVADRKLSCFPEKGNWVLHHAAPFAAVRWTNIHDPTQFVFFGDIVSSPAAPVFGAGAIDIDLKEVRGQSGDFSHLRYWSVPDPADPPEPVKKLREALDLAGERGLI